MALGIFLLLWSATSGIWHLFNAPAMKVWKAASNAHAIGINTTAWDRLILEGNLKLLDGGRFAWAFAGLNVWARWSWPWRKYVA